MSCGVRLFESLPQSLTPTLHRPLQANPDKYKPMLEALLKESGVDFGYSQSSKFANFVNKSLL